MPDTLKNRLRVPEMIKDSFTMWLNFLISSYITKGNENISLCRNMAKIVSSRILINYKVWKIQMSIN